ncbi:hypothetical protein V7179_07690 [Priestia megaterium]|uniref:hypothetical protein n=1 Tax=Priestia megaterium TaxID=1404 RepID=UPI001145CD16|nr:hypothetical protein [Priestia megaterium]
MIGEQGEDSCGNSGTDQRPRRSASNEEAHRPPAESEALHGNQQRCNKWSIRVPLFHLFVFRLN